MDPTSYSYAKKGQQTTIILKKTDMMCKMEVVFLVSHCSSRLYSQQRKMFAAMLLRTDMMYNIMNREESTNSTMNIT